MLKYLSENPCAKRVESLVEVELKQGPLPSACAVRLVPTSHHPWPPGFGGNFHSIYCHWYCHFFFDSFTSNWRRWMGNVHHVSIHLKGFHHLYYVNFHSTQIACHHLFFDPIGGMVSNFPKLQQFWNFFTSSWDKLDPGDVSNIRLIFHNLTWSKLDPFYQGLNLMYARVRRFCTRPM